MERKRSSKFFIGIIIGLIIGLWFGINLGKGKPIYTNPFSKKQIQTTLRKSGEKVIEKSEQVIQKSGEVLEETGKTLQETITKE